jgi:hypothetical protein
MNCSQSLVPKRHEVMVQELRRERKKEAQHLKDVEAVLKTKLNAVPEKRVDTRAA